jgi:ketosteroid isomerase-like protein
MIGDEAQIRELIERWTRAIQAGDLAGVLTDHADDIIMYDVPPPYQGVKGIEAYGQAWPEFLQWQATGATFELAGLDVTAGDTVAYAHALLRCGTPAELARKPDYLLRLTLGLRKEQGPVGRRARAPFVPRRPRHRQPRGIRTRSAHAASAMVRSHRGEGPRRADEAHRRSRHLL